MPSLFVRLQRWQNLTPGIGTRMISPFGPVFAVVVF